MKRYATHKSTAGPASRTIGSIGFALAVIAFLAKRFGLIDADVFVLSLVAAALVGLMTLALALIGLQRVWTYGGPGVSASLTGILFGALTLLPPALVLGLLIVRPAAGDLSTNRFDPPVFTVEAESSEEPFLAWLNTALENQVWPLLALARGEAGAASPEDPRLYLDIVSRRYRISPGELHAAGEKAVRNLNWNVVDELPPDLLDAPTQLQAEGTTRILGLKHDVTLRIRPDAVGALLDVRARSQTPLKDLPDNAGHIRSVFTEIDRVLRETYGNLAQVAVDENAPEEELTAETLEEQRDVVPVPDFKPYFEDPLEAPEGGTEEAGLAG